MMEDDHEEGRLGQKRLRPYTPSETSDSDNSFILSPFKKKKTAVTPLRGPTIPSTKLFDTPKIETSKYLELQEELNKVKKRCEILEDEKNVASQSSQQVELSLTDNLIASTLHSYIDKLRVAEQKISQLDTIKQENSILKENNQNMSLIIDRLNSQVQTLIADSGQQDVGTESQISIIKQELENQISQSRQQRDAAIEKMQQEKRKNNELSVQLEFQNDEISQLKSQIGSLESRIQSLLEENNSFVSQMKSLSSSLTANMMQASNLASSMTDRTSSDPLIHELRLEAEEYRMLKPSIQVLKKDASRVPDLESQVEALKLELAIARSSKNESETLQNQLEKSFIINKNLEEKYQNLIKENQALKEASNVWNQCIGELSKGSTSDDIVQFISDLQSENHQLRDEVGLNHSQIKVLQVQITTLTDKLKEAERSQFELKSENSDLSGTISQLESKIKLSELEYSGLLSLLDSYKLEENYKMETDNGQSTFDQPKSAHIAHLEKSLASRTEYCSQLEKELKEIKAELLSLNKYAKRLVDEKSILEHRLGRGDLDSQVTKVLHLSQTPLHILKEKENSAKLEDLSRHLKDAEDELALFKSSQNLTSSTQISAESASHPVTMIDPAIFAQQQKELKTLRHQLKESTVSTQRLKSATEVMVRRYMASVWNIFGWKVDFEEKNRVKVRYKYRNDQIRTSQKMLMFEFPSTLGTKGANDQLEPFTMLHTPDLDDLDPSLLDILKRPNSLPYFISQLTSHLFSMVEANSPQTR